MDKIRYEICSTEIETNLIELGIFIDKVLSHKYTFSRIIRDDKNNGLIYLVSNNVKIVEIKLVLSKSDFLPYNTKIRLL